jgi:RNA polymerase sigma-70 factor (ECF subfamily)
MFPCQGNSLTEHRPYAFEDRGWMYRDSVRSRTHGIFGTEEKKMLSTGRQEQTPITGHDQDDLALLQRIAAHDHQSFERLYQRYTPRLSRYLRTLLESRELVEDVLHDVWMVVWHQAARYRASGRVSTWLFGIARHKALKARTRETRYPLSQTPIPDQVDPTDPEYQVTSQECVRRVQQALATLSPVQREVLMLMYEHGYSAQAIATLQDCSVATVYYRKQQAHHCLATRLGLGTRDLDHTF